MILWSEESIGSKSLKEKLLRIRKKLKMKRKNLKKRRSLNKLRKKPKMFLRWLKGHLQKFNLSKMLRTEWNKSERTLLNFTVKKTEKSFFKFLTRSMKKSTRKRSLKEQKISKNYLFIWLTFLSESMSADKWSKPISLALNGVCSTAQWKRSTTCFKILKKTTWSKISSYLKTIQVMSKALMST